MEHALSKWNELGFASHWVAAATYLFWLLIWCRVDVPQSSSYAYLLVGVFLYRRPFLVDLWAWCIRIWRIVGNSGSCLRRSGNSGVGPRKLRQVIENEASWLLRRICALCIRLFRFTLIRWNVLAYHTLAHTVINYHVRSTMRLVRCPLN